MPLNPAIGSALVSGGSSLLGTIVQAKAQEHANDTYLKGVRETNKANKELYEQQMRDVRSNWSMENAYNSPSAQLARLRQAGINTSDVLSNGNAQSVQNVSASPFQAPAQTSAPNYGSGLSESVQSAFLGYRQAQQMEMDKYNIYQKGIESQFYLRQKLNEVNLQEAELLSKDTMTESDKARLAMLRTDARFYEEKLRQQMSINDETLQNLKRSGREIDKRIARDDALALASMKHMSVQEAVDWYNAKTGRKVAENDAQRIGNEYSKSIVELYQSYDRFKWDKEVQEKAHELAENYYNLTSSEKRIARAIMMQQLKMLGLEEEKLRQLVNSPFGNMLRNVLGLDPSVIGSAAVGAGAAMMLK